MSQRVTRLARLSFVFGVAGLGVAACTAAAPTAPSAPPASESALRAVTTSQVATASVASSSASVGSAPPAADKGVRLTKGSLTLPTFQAGTLTLKGTRGFQFDGYISSGLEPNVCSPFDPCQPGATAAYAASWVGTDISGTVRLMGDEFAVGSADGGSLYLELHASFVVPAHLTPTTTVTVPFTSTGLITRDYPLPQVPFSGSGRVTFTLEWQAAIGGWAVRVTSFDFGNVRFD